MRRIEPQLLSNDDSRFLSTMQVASALGVSVSTVKRWVDEGILPAQRTVGGHRKLLQSEVVRLVRSGNLPQSDLSHLLPKPREFNFSQMESLCAEFHSALRKPDAEIVRALLQGAYRHGYALEELADRVIGPSMAQIGHAWETGEVEVIQEHLATQAIVVALYEMSSQPRPQNKKDRPVAIGGAPENDFSIIPTLLAKLVLVDAGWHAIDLGPHTPFNAFRTALVELKPRLVWLSASHLIDPDEFQKEYRSFYRQAEALGIPVAIGGCALTDTIRSRMPYTTFGDGLSHLAAFARTLHRGPAPPRRGRPASRKSPR